MHVGEEKIRREIGRVEVGVGEHGRDREVYTLRNKAGEFNPNGSCSISHCERIFQLRIETWNGSNTNPPVVLFLLRVCSGEER